MTVQKENASGQTTDDIPVHPPGPEHFEWVMKQATEIVADLRSEDPEMQWCGEAGLFQRAADEIERLRSVLTEIARLGVDMRSDFSRSAAQAKLAREALNHVA